jgi:uncharacterized glyoxalase superfamily protein PhnB
MRMRVNGNVPELSIVQALRYRDLADAVDWLCRAFDFQKHYVVSDQDGSLSYAQLTYGSSMIVLGPVRDSAFDRLFVQPEEVGGAETQCCYLVTADIDALYARAKAAGADILFEPGPDGEGERQFTCRDPEGHIWNFGTHDPWRDGAPKPRPAPKHGGTVTLLAALAVAVLSFAGAGWTYLDYSRLHGEIGRLQSAEFSARREAQEAVDLAGQENRARVHAEQVLKAIRLELDSERKARIAAERSREARNQYPPAPVPAAGPLTQELTARIAAEQGARTAAERVAADLRQQLEAERGAHEALARAARSLREQLTSEREARRAAEQQVAKSGEELARERMARAAAEQAQQSARSQLAQIENAKLAAERTTKELQSRLSQLASESARRSDIETQLVQERSLREAAESGVKEIREQLDRERRAREAAEQAQQAMKGRLAEIEDAKSMAERASRELQNRLSVLAGADASRSDLEAQLTEERKAREAAEATVKDLTDQLAAERNARLAAEKTVQGVRSQLNKERAARKAAAKAAVSDSQ